MCMYILLQHVPLDLLDLRDELTEAAGEVLLHGPHVQGGILGGHAGRPHPQKSDFVNLLNLDCCE